MEEVEDGGAHGEVMNRNSREEDEAVADVLLPKKRRERPLASGKNKVSGPRRGWKRSGSEYSENNEFGDDKSMGRDIFSKHTNRGQNVSADGRSMPPTVRNDKIEGLAKNKMGYFSARCICLDNLLWTSGAGSRNGKLV